MSLAGSLGLKSAFNVAALLLQDIVARSISLTQTTGNIAVQLVTGARLKLGGGTTDYLTSDGSATVTAAGNFGVGAGVTLTGAGAATFASQATVPTIFATSTNGLSLFGQDANDANAVGVKIGNTPQLTTTGGKICAIYSDTGTTEVLAVDVAGKIINATAGNSTGTPGAATLNTPSGRSAIAIGAAAVTVTNSLVSATSIVFAVIQTADATLTTLLRVVPGAGTFTITGNANATAATNVGWIVFNV